MEYTIKKIKYILIYCLFLTTTTIGQLSNTPTITGRVIDYMARPVEGKAEWIAEPVEVTTETGETKSDVKVELSKGGILEVVVTETANKQPIEKAGIHILPKGDGRATGILTDKDGIARINLLPGEYYVGGIQKQGYSSYKRQDEVTIEEGKTKHLEFQLTRQPRIAGIVRDEEGKPVGSVDIEIVPLSRRDSSTDSDGRFSINWNPRWSGPEEMVYFLVARHRQRNLAAVVEITEDEDIEALDVRLEPGVIVTGKVVDPNDRGIDGAQIRVHLHTSGWSTTFGQEQAKTDTEGTFEIKAIPAEHKYSIYAETEGYGQRNVRIHTDDAVDGHLDIGVLKLTLANLSVSGIVVDINDIPLANVRIYCYGENQPHRDTQTDEEGIFTLEKVCAGRIGINANVRGQRRLYGRVDTEGGATDVKIVLSERSSSGRYVPRRPPSLAGKALPELKDLGIELPPVDANDTMILVCFWDMEQRPSRRCMLELNKRAEELKQKGLTVVAVHASKIDEDTLNDWLEKKDISFPAGMIRSEVNKTKFAWGVRALPWLVLTDSEHVVRAEGFGVNELNDKIKEVADAGN